MHAYLQSFGVDWSQVGGGLELGRAGVFLHYDWKSGPVVNVGALQAKFSWTDDE